MLFYHFSYEVMGEVAALIMSLILTINMVINFSVYERMHRFFLYAGICSILSTATNIASVYYITYYSPQLHTMAMLTSSLYYIFLISVPVIITVFTYTITQNQKGFNIALTFNLILYFMYVALILINSKTGIIFGFDENSNYVHGSLKNITYTLTMFFILQTLINIFVNHKKIAKYMLVVFALYPVLLLVIISFQFFFPKTIFTGIAQFGSLLFLYVSIQSGMIEYDIKTGLSSEAKLKKDLAQKKAKGYLYFLSIDNIEEISTILSIEEFTIFISNLTSLISTTFPRKAYRISIGLYAAICKNEETLKNKSLQINKSLEKINNLMESKKPILVYYSSAATRFSGGPDIYAKNYEIIHTLLRDARMNESRKLAVCTLDTLNTLERKKTIQRILERELRFESTQFQVYYQPIYSIKDKKFKYMEALARLNNTELGNISPGEFIPIAESKGLIEKLGSIVFDKVCSFISKNRDVVKAVSVNFCVNQILNKNIVDDVLNTLQLYNLETDRIIIEITESIFIEKFEIVKNNMIELAKKGIRFYLDDFGTGYSNIANVISLPFTTIKIDRSLVLMSDDDKKKKLFKNFVSTFKDAGLSILVEGVENATQDTLVKVSSADYIQGFLYSRPLPEDECLKLLKSE